MEILPLFNKNAGTMDYVSAWYVKATRIMEQNRKIKTAFVSTNSITQGEQVEPLWKPLFDVGIKINFAYTTFKWSNEARGMAAVHVVIIGFSFQPTEAFLYTPSGKDFSIKKCENINAYLADGPDVFIKSRSKPLSDVPPIETGNQPIDGGHYLFTKEEMEQFIEIEPIVYYLTIYNNA